MRQAELHLELSLPPGLRGPVGDATAGGMAGELLPVGRKTSGQESPGRVEGKGEIRMEQQEATIAFVIPGVPVGKGRPKFARRGNFVSTYTPEKTASYENLVKVKADEAMGGRAVIEGPVAVVVELFVVPPSSWSQKKQREALAGRLFPTSKPDIDNVVKGIFDACNDIVWKDDKQAVDLVVMKRYDTAARARVEVTAI